MELTERLKTAICECAHISHFDFSARTPDGLQGHRPFDPIPKEHMTTVKVDGRTAIVCKNCAGDCLGKPKHDDGIDRKEAVAALLFDSDVWDEEESPRPSEEAVHKLAEELIEFFDNQRKEQQTNDDNNTSTQA